MRPECRHGERSGLREERTLGRKGQERSGEVRNVLAVLGSRAISWGGLAVPHGS